MFIELYISLLSQQLLTFNISSFRLMFVLWTNTNMSSQFQVQADLNENE